MRIVLVNWAKVWDGASHGGGVNGYCQALAHELHTLGHEVSYLCSGTTYVSPPAECVIRRHDDWLGVRVFEVINSPVIAPSLPQFRDPLAEISAPELEARLDELFARVRPDVVHWHNIEGFTAGCVAAATRAGARNFFSLHNYHTLCPQVYFMQGHRNACHDSRGGRACVGCIDAPAPASERARLAAQYAARNPPPRCEPIPTPREQARLAWQDFRAHAGWPWRAGKALVRTLALTARALTDPPVAPLAQPTPPLPGNAIAQDRAELAPQPPPGKDLRGKTQYFLSQNEPRWVPDMSDPERKPLLNVIQPDPPHPDGPNEYGARRAAMVRMLNSCDRVLAVSDFVRRKFESMGVRPDVIRAVTIGTRINRIVARTPELAFAPPPIDPAAPRPIRLVFMGYNNYYKGLSMFVESLEMLDATDLARLDLAIFALDGQTIEWMFRRMEPRLARLTFSTGYEHHDIPWLLGGRDLGVVPSVWWDNAPQTVMEFQACGLPVLGAELGGIPDFVRDGHNGILFRGNDREDLARKLRSLIRDPARLNDLRRNVRPPKSIDDHARELVAQYEEVARAAPPLPPVTSVPTANRGTPSPA
ncbi:MAG: glycosyltransferase [Phycisphaerae bacterium]|nr:glycosyltransferase [Phycisphaerae bacterium]